MASYSGSPLTGVERGICKNTVLHLERMGGRKFTKQVEGGWSNFFTVAIKSRVAFVADYDAAVHRQSMKRVRTINCPDSDETSEDFDRRLECGAALPRI